jgi:hypothetical protein
MKTSRAEPEQAEAFGSFGKDFLTAHCLPGEQSKCLFWRAPNPVGEEMVKELSVPQCPHLYYWHLLSLADSAPVFLHPLLFLRSLPGTSYPLAALRAS